MVWLNNSRIISIFAVVFLHTAAIVVIDSSIGTESWWLGNLYDSLVRWCVPVFVMISGALLLDPGKTEDLKTFYLKRLSRILIPIIFWSIFFLLWPVMKGEYLGVDDLAKKFAMGLLSGRPYYHLWFLYMIVFLYLFTPFFRKIISNSSRSEIKILVLLSFSIAALNAIATRLGVADSKLFFNWFLAYIPYFFLGYLVRTSSINYPKPVLFGVFGVFIFLTALGCYFLAINRGLDAGLYFYDYLSITVIPMSIIVFFLLKLWGKPILNELLTNKISSLTLGIYLIHPIFLEAVIYFGYGPLAFTPSMSIPVLSVVVFVLSLSMAWVIDKTPYIKRLI